ncbi:MAG TPA: C40 family peptidase [Thermomicrobiales bacterium]|nr:C40 family peptidase [Thermomicrobiales bacterium]
MSGPHYDADGTPWYEVDAGGFVPASALGTGTVAPVEAETAYQPEGKEASYAVAQETGDAAPVEVAADVAPAETAPAEAPAPAIEPDPMVELEVAPAPAAYDPSNVVATAWIAGTNGDGAVCRAGADWGAAEAGWLAEGSAVDVIGETTGEWQPVSCGGVAGFVHASFIAWEPPANVDASGDDNIDLTTGLETGPAADPAVAEVEAAPADVAQRDRRGGNDDVAADDGDSNGGGDDASGGGGGSGQEMADFAMQYVGYPYVYAGEGPYAFDCSGFTMFVAKNVLGMDITHDMFVQVGMGQSVSRGQLQPGDLVFFQNTFRDGLSHSGIYIGGGQFVHAENESTGVRVSDIDSDYYASRWYGATRLT